MRRLLGGVVLLLAAGLVAGCGEALNEPTANPKGAGAVAAEIEGEDADGVTFKLSDYRGKVVLLDFWAGW